MHDKWELYNLDEDWTQADDFAEKMPEKLEQMKALFPVEAARNKDMPIGGGLWTGLHPEDRGASPHTEWTFRAGVTRMPEFSAPKLGNRNNLVTLEVDVPQQANGVLYSLGGFSGGLACYVLDGVLCFEYNMFEITRTQIKSSKKLPTGNVKIEVETKLAKAERGAPLARPKSSTSSNCLPPNDDIPGSNPLEEKFNWCPVTPIFGGASIFWDEPIGDDRVINWCLVHILFSNHKYLKSSFSRRHASRTMI